MSGRGEKRVRGHRPEGLAANVSTVESSSLLRKRSRKPNPCLSSTTTQSSSWSSVQEVGLANFHAERELSFSQSVNETVSICCKVLVKS